MLHRKYLGPTAVSFIEVLWFKFFFMESQVNIRGIQF